AAFMYFVGRDRQPPVVEAPEDVLIDMVVALGEGNVVDFLHCFGGDLGRHLQSVVSNQGEDQISGWLKDRGRQVKGFAILEKETIGSDGFLVKTETVYEDKNTGQTFLLELQEGTWKIVQSDFEMVSNWDTDFGKPIWEAR
ncbi:hypothetical protein MYX84_12270, partial [Acidobacteria bacterium AH-259-O06]|nr:hypothetical protein [Acidobacteria bacterium AH-259-O06]